MSSEIKLKRLCQKEPLARMVSGLVHDASLGILAIVDADEKVIFGEANPQEPRHAISQENGEAVGWVYGLQNAQHLAQWLSFAAQKELESKALAQETLSKYKELTLLYELGEKVSACLETAQLTQLALVESQRLLPSGKTLQIGVLLTDAAQKSAIVHAGQGELFVSGAAIEPLDGITQRVVLSGNSEIINDIAADSGYLAEPGCLKGMNALLCVPLKTADRSYGVILVVTDQPVTFRAAEQKVINLLASQIATALGRVDLISAKVEQELLQESLKLSRDIQMSMLSTDFPRLSKNSPIDLFAYMQPAKEVGGDFYDFFYLNPDKLLIVIGDVSGKGVPAALFMVMAKTLIRAIAKHEHEPKNILETLNPELCRDNDSAMFVTLFLATLQLSTGELWFSFAGHNPPLLIRQNGEVSYLVAKTSGTAAGIIDICCYSEQSMRLQKGDALVLYTDGVTEAMNPTYELYNEERLQTHVTGLPTTHNAEALVESILESVKAFAEDAEQSDDITLLALRLGD
jgi:serine phosphatase RsbU (regulator of sigma subunit)